MMVSMAFPEVLEPKVKMQPMQVVFGHGPLAIVHLENFEKYDRSSKDG